MRKYLILFFLCLLSAPVFASGEGENETPEEMFDRAFKLELDARECTEDFAEQKREEALALWQKASDHGYFLAHIALICYCEYQGLYGDAQTYFNKVIQHESWGFLSAWSLIECFKEFNEKGRMPLKYFALWFGERLPLKDTAIIENNRAKQDVIAGYQKRRKEFEAKREELAALYQGDEDKIGFLNRVYQNLIDGFDKMIAALEGDAE